MDSVEGGAASKSTDSRKPFKVWSTDRKQKKSVVAATLGELRQQGCQKLSCAVSGDLRVVLESDGTEVDDEDYFAFLDPNTTFIFLQAGQHWQPEGSTGDSADETDFISSLEVQADGEDDDSDEEVSDSIQTRTSRPVKELVKIIKHDISKLITFSDAEFQKIVDMDRSLLASCLHDTPGNARGIQDACQRYLDDRLRATEAMDLLKLYHKAKTTLGSNSDQQSSRKRQKTE